MSGPEDSPDRGPLVTRWSERDPDNPVWGPAANRANLRQAATRARRRRRRRRALLGAALALVAIVGALAGYGEYLNHEIRRLDVRGLSAASSSGVQNILMVGSTSRCVLQQQNIAFGLCSQGVNGVNSDVVMLLHLDPKTKKVAILSLPRDLFVPNARTTGPNKIDAALYQGPSQLVAAIQQDFGIPIQHYVVLNFETFQGIVNALGGIKMYFPMPVYDAESELDIRQTGCLPLNGFQALAVVRARHLQYKPPSVTSMNHYVWPSDPQSDLSRIRRSHEFIRVLAGEVSKRGLSNPLTDQSLVSAVAPDLQVDSGLSATDMINLVLTFHNVNPAGAPQATLPVLVHAGLDYYYQGYNYGSVELTSEPQDRQAVYQFLGLAPGHDTMTGAPLPSPSSVTVSVVNGTGLYNQAADTAQALGALGFQATEAGNVSSPANPSETLVVYNAKSAGGLAAAEAVAQNLTGSVVLDAGQPSGGAQVTVVTGTVFAVTAPAAPSPGTSTPGTSVTPTTSSGLPTTTTTSPGSRSLSAPTNATETLEPWDPRSCTASGGEGP